MSKTHAQFPLVVHSTVASYSPTAGVRTELQPKDGQIFAMFKDFLVSISPVGGNRVTSTPSLHRQGRGTDVVVRDPDWPVRARVDRSVPRREPSQPPLPSDLSTPHTSPVCGPSAASTFNETSGL